MTNYNERLDEILRELDRGEYLDKGGVPGAKQAILDWHNKRVLAIIGDDVELDSFDVPMYEAEYVITSVTAQNQLRAEQRDKLKEQTNDQL